MYEGNSNDLFPSDIPTKTLWGFPFSPVYVAWLAHLIGD